MFLGSIIEGPSKWTVRPVEELLYEREFGQEETFSGLVGLIWQVSDKLAFDVAYRYALTNHHPVNEVRAALIIAFRCGSSRAHMPDDNDAPQQSFKAEAQGTSAALASQGVQMMPMRTIFRTILCCLTVGSFAPAQALTQQELVAKLGAAGYTQIRDIKSTAEGIAVKATKNGKDVSLVVDSSGQVKERP
ncbi:hypothetical protein ACFFWD_08165 [Bradyrhizobium erythrophlei]|uniref:hypothetical protein n=1 Tax=Bradyrhizobium erythrophlei TaxID=1437360 RepID=UPI0035ED9518